MLSRPPRLPTIRAGQQPALLSRRLDGIAAAYAIRAVIAGVERIRNVPRWRGSGLLARPPSASAYFIQLRQHRRQRGRLLGHSRFPGRHDMGRGFRRLDRDGFHENWRDHRPLCREALSPGYRTNMRIDAPGPVFDRPARSNVHDLDDPAARRTSATRDSQQFTAVGGFGLVVFEAGEDPIFVVHGRPIWRGEAALRRRSEAWWSINDSQQWKIAGAIGLLNFGSGRGKTSP